MCNYLTMRPVVLIFFYIGLALAKNDYYDGHSLYEVFVETFDQVKLVNELDRHLELDIWSQAHPGRPGQILVSEDKKTQFESILKRNGVEFNIETENIKELIDLEEQLLARASQKSYNSSQISYDRIHTYEEVNEFLHYLAEKYPSIVTLVNGGKSFEGKDIFYIKISTTKFQDTSKPIIFMESLLHAREWITLPATLYAIEKLVGDVTDFARNIDWIVLPIANPDGYIFTHNENRFWRKNRATGYTPNDSCIGVDLNRNFDIDWSTASSSNVCSETFHGRGPFSEPETSVVRDIFEEYGDSIKIFLDIHCCGSMILYGWGNTTLPPNALNLQVLGVRMAGAIDAVKMSYNPNYIVGNSALVLYESSGSGQDYGQAAGAGYSYTFELPRHRNGTGLQGFLVHPEFIEQAGFETWEGIKEGARFVLNRAKKT